MKEIHFDSVGFAPDTIISWDEASYALESGDEYISTVQMGLLSEKLFELGYRVFVRDWDGEHEITHLSDARRSELRNDKASLFDMWREGKLSANLEKQTA